MSIQLQTNDTECEWVIIDGGACVPASSAKPEQNPQKVSIPWIEASRRDWAKLAGKLLRFIEYKGITPEWDEWRTGEDV